MAQRHAGDVILNWGCLVAAGGAFICALILAFRGDTLVLRHILGAGVAMIVLYWVMMRVRRAWPTPATLKARIMVGLTGDLFSLALWSWLGMIAVLLVQFLLYISPAYLGPDQVASVQFRIYDFNRGLGRVVSLRNVSLALAAAALLAVLVRAWWPVIMLGKARKVLSNAIAFFGAIAGFTLVAVETADLNYDSAVRSTRIAIVRDLDRIAAARRDHAAFRWLAAELALERHENPNVEADWRHYFAARADECRRREDEGGGRCDPAAQILRGARASVGGREGVPPPAPGNAWLWDFRDVLKLRIPDFHGVLTEATYAILREDLGSRPLLEGLRARAATAAAEADEARGAVRDLVVEGITSLLGDSYGGIAGEVANVMRDAMASALATEADERIRAWWRSRHQPIPRLFDADRRLVSLAGQWRYQTITPAAPAPAPAPAVAIMTGGGAPATASTSGAAVTSDRPIATGPPSGITAPMTTFALPAGTILAIRPEPIIVPPHVAPVPAAPVVVRFR